MKKSPLLLTLIPLTLAGTLSLTGCTGFGSGNENTEETEATETTTIPPTTSTYSSENTAHYESPAASQRDVSWDIRLDKLEVKKFLTPAGASEDDYSARIFPTGSGNKFIVLDLTLKNTGYGKQSFLAYESADICSELIYENERYFATYTTGSTEGYEDKPVSNFLDIDGGDESYCQIAFEVPSDAAEPEKPLKYHLYFTDGDDSDGIYITLR